MNLNLTQIRDRIWFATQTQNREEWDRITKEDYRPVLKKVFITMFVDVMYELMSEGSNVQAEYLWMCITISTVFSTSFRWNVMSGTLRKFYHAKNVDAILKNNWIIDTVNSYALSYLEDSAIVTYFMRIIVSNQSFFKTDKIWYHITNLTRAHLINPEEILKLALESDLPDIMENIVEVFCADDAYENEFYRIVDLLLQHNFQPSYSLIKYIIQENNVDILELFDKYNINIKQIIDKNDPICDKMEAVLSKLNISLGDYVSIMGNF